MTKYGPESKNLWIQARIDELMDDDEWVLEMKKKWFYCEDDVIYSLIKTEATEQATREHAEIEAMILDAQIDNLELG